jgi:chromosome segregation ATPase/cytoskeletal protein CcmA (bactofilin family)
MHIEPGTTMTALNNKPENQGLFRRAGALFKGRRHWLEIPGYQVGDIVSAQPVHIAATAAVAGDVIAPKLVVAGLLFGSAGAWEVTVAQGGCIWGDVCAGAIQVEAGGRVHGWLSTLDEPGFQALLNGQSSLRTIATTDEAGILADLEAHGLAALLPAGPVVDPANRLAIMHRLQEEAGAAMAARRELEYAFDERLAELADQALSEAAALSQEVISIREKLSAAEEQLDEREIERQQQGQRIAGYVDELAQVRDTLNENSVALAEATATLEQQAAEIATLSDARTTLTGQLTAMTLQVESLTERLEHRESALQASLQRAADLEESLLRWQELADTTEKRVTVLQQEVADVSAEVEESVRIQEIMRKEREKLQLAWNNVSTEALSWQAQAGQLEEERDALRQEAAFLREQLLNRPPADEEVRAQLGQVQAELLDAKAHVAELEKRLDGAEAEVQAYYDQLLWYKASLKTTSLELEQVQQQAAEQGEELVHLRQESAERQSQVDKWKANIGRMTELLYAAEQRIRNLQTEVTALKDQSEEESQSLREAVRQSQLQLQAVEAEVDGYFAQFEAQSKRLAEAQALLIEREVEVERLRAQTAAASHEVSRLKELAARRIRTLEEELAEARRQLQDMVNFLERRRRREDRADEADGKS